MDETEFIARALYDRHWSAVPEGSRPAWPGDSGPDYWLWLATAAIDAIPRSVQMQAGARARLADWLNAFKADPFSTGADKVDRLLEVLAMRS